MSQTPKAHTNSAGAPYEGAPFSRLFQAAERTPAALLGLLVVLCGVVYAFGLLGNHFSVVAVCVFPTLFGLAVAVCAGGVFRSVDTSGKGRAIVLLFCFLALAGKWGAQYWIDVSEGFTEADLPASMFGALTDADDFRYISTSDGYFSWVSDRADVGFLVEECGLRCTRVVDQRWVRKFSSHFFQGNIMWLLWAVEAAYVYAWCSVSLIVDDPRRKRPPAHKRRAKR